MNCRSNKRGPDDQGQDGQRHLVIQQLQSQGEHGATISKASVRRHRSRKEAGFGAGFAVKAETKLDDIDDELSERNEIPGVAAEISRAIRSRVQLQ